MSKKAQTAESFERLRREVNSCEYRQNSVNLRAIKFDKDGP
jgi:hypothetical protein